MMKYFVLSINNPNLTTIKRGKEKLLNSKNIYIYIYNLYCYSPQAKIKLENIKGH